MPEAVNILRILVLLTFVLQSPAGALPVGPDRKPNIRTLEETAGKELSQPNIPGAAIAIVSGARIIYAKGIRISNIEAGTPVAP